MRTVLKIAWFTGMILAACVAVGILWSVSLGWSPTVGIGS